MDPELKALLDKYAAAGASDDEMRHVASDWQAQRGGSTGAAATPPAADGSSMSLGNMARAAGVGATFGLGKSTSLPAGMRIDGAKADAFKNANPITDFLLKFAGGAVAPVAAAAAAPELLGGFLGTVGLGAGTGALAAAGENSDKDMAGGDRAKQIAAGAGLGAAGGAAGYGASKAVGNMLGSLLDRLHPERVLAREAAKIVTPADLARMNTANDIAPGSASLGTSTLPPKLTPKAADPRFTSDARGVGAAPDRGMGAEATLAAQRQAIDAGKRAIGARMDALPSSVNVTPSLRRTLAQVYGVLGDKNTPQLPDADFRLVTEATPDREIETAQSPHPELRQAIGDFWDRIRAAQTRKDGTIDQQMAKTALDRHITESQSNGIRGTRTVVPGNPAVLAPETADTQVLRDALGRLRYLARNADKRGTDMNGPTAYEIKGARNTLQDYLYKNVDGLSGLDGQYAKVMEQERAFNTIAKTAQRSIQNHTTAATTGADAGSVGGSLFKTPSTISILTRLARQATQGADGGTNSVMSPKMAGAVSKYILTPGDATVYDRLLAAGKPYNPRFQQSANAMTTAIPPALRSLLQLYPTGTPR